MLKLTKNQGNLLVLVVTIIWGSGFVVTKYLLDIGISAGLITALRGAALALITFAIAPKKILKMPPKYIIAGLIAGVTNAVAIILQSVGLIYTTPTVCAFLTILYIVFVPFISMIFYKKRPSLQIYPGIILALVGMFFLTGISFTDFNFDIGTLICTLGALSFAISISFIGNSAKDVPFECIAFMMGLTQLILSFAYIAIFDKFSFPKINWNLTILPFIYLAVFGTFITTNAQVIAQKVTDETTASVIMSMEAVFGAIISIVFGYDVFSLGLLIGSLLIFTGVLIATLNFDSVIKYFKRILNL